MIKRILPQNGSSTSTLKKIDTFFDSKNFNLTFKNSRLYLIGKTRLKFCESKNVSKNLELILLAPIILILFQPKNYGAAAVPIMDLPVELRVNNWGGGSCVHASTVHLLRWQGKEELANWWRNNYSGGENLDGLNHKMEKAGLRFAYTGNGDTQFLEWAIRTRRGAGISYYPNHAINLVHLDSEKAGLLDNNRINEIIWVPRDEFIRNWKGYGGWGWSLVHTPAPPLPVL